MTEPRPRHILVAALGATLRGDDGFGPKLLARIARRLPPLVCGRDFGTHGLALVQALFDRFDVLLILDACRRGGRPGTIYTLRPAVVDRLDSPSVHLTGPGAVLSLASNLGVLPPDVWLIGCEPADVSDYRRRLSRPVRRAMPHAAQTLCALIGRVST